jgi:hypothetical protein
MFWICLILKMAHADHAFQSSYTDYPFPEGMTAFLSGPSFSLTTALV